MVTSDPEQILVPPLIATVGLTVEVAVNTAILEVTSPQSPVTTTL